MVRKLLFLCVSSVALSACQPGLTESAPVMAGQAAPITAQERQQGTQANPDLLAEFGGAYSGPQASYTESIGRKIAVQSGLSSSPGAFDVALLNSPINNAFAIPGGYIYITRQLVALMNDEAELAAVLGHEVAHVAARHSAKRQSAAQRNTILGVLGQVLVGAVAGDSQIGEVLQQGIGTGTQLVTLGYSRSQETQADDLAVQYLSRGGYDPAAMASALRSLAAQNSLDQQIAGAGDARSVPEWVSTHPDPQSRVQRAASQAASTNVTNGKRNRDVFLTAIDGIMYGDDPKHGVVQGRTFVHPVFRLAFTVPEGFTMQNGTEAVSISGPNAQALFSTRAYEGNLETYVMNVLRDLSKEGGAMPQASVERTSVNGVPAAFAQVRANSGSSQVDVTVFAYAPSTSKAFHFVALSPAGQGLGAMTSMVQSFRTLSASDAAAIRARYVRVVTVKAGDTPTSLADRMAFPDHKLERFLVLNGLDSGARLAAGQKVKIVTY